MDDLIPIAYLNDFIFCPASIYFHNLYGSREQMTYQKAPQLNGKKAHEKVDNESYLQKKNLVTGIDVYCEKYGLIGKIDILDEKNHQLMERKKKIKQIYEGYVFQLYGQYFSLIEMGYKVELLCMYSMDDNKKYHIKLPQDDEEMLRKFENVITSLKTMKINEFKQSNKEKCANCIYFDACDRGVV
ncbi:MAG: type V CRISPR-associated protein Cas4 [Erysipelotrichaceae bacterium]